MEFPCNKNVLWLRLVKGDYFGFSWLLIFFGAASVEVECGAVVDNREILWLKAGHADLYK